MNHDVHHCACCVHQAINLKNVGVCIGPVRILHDVTASVPFGMNTAIVGPNGAGKSTLAKTILGEYAHTGTIEFGNASGQCTGRRPRFGYVPQRLNFDRDMPLTVVEFLASSLQRYPVFFGVRKSFRKQCMEMLEQVECSHSADRSLGALSGGELQRVLLAQALMQKPEILLLDEPVSGVDFKGEQLCCELLETFRRDQKFTLLTVSHDLASVAAHADHVICINKTVIAQGSPEEVLTKEVLHEAFGLHVDTFDFHGKRGCSCSK